MILLTLGMELKRIGHDTTYLERVDDRFLVLFHRLVWELGAREQTHALQGQVA